MVNGNSVNCPSFGLTKVSTNKDFWNAQSWCFITAIVDNGFIKIYVDGEFQNSQVTTSGVFTDNQIYIGRYFSPQQWSVFNGTIDDIRIYNRVLNDHETNNVFNETITGNTAVTYNNAIKIYPNPTSDYIYINVDDSNLGYKMKIINTLGQEVFNTRLSLSQYYLDLSTWTGNGIYFAQIYGVNDNLVDVKKIIIQ